MKRSSIVAALVASLVVAVAQSGFADGKGVENKTVQKIKIVQEHPRNYVANVGDVVQFYVAFPIVPGQMVKPEEVKCKVKPSEGQRAPSLKLIGILSTQDPMLIGAGEVSAMLYAQTKGTSYVTFQPIPGHTQKPIRIAVVVEP